MISPFFPKSLSQAALPLAVTLAGGLFFTSCLSPEQPGTGVLDEAPAKPLSQEEGFRVLESMGFSRDKILAAGSHFVVEGDMVFSAEDLARQEAYSPGEEGAPLPKTAQRVFAAIRTPKPNLVRLAIHSSMTDWAKYVHQGVNTWNAPNTRLHIEVVPITGSPNITIYSDASADCPDRHRNLPDGVGGQADVPGDGNPGPALCINKNSPFITTDVKRVMTITHELGHTLGFFHTDGTEGTLIPNTGADAFSLMNSGGNLDGALTFGDVKALEILYPSDKPLGGTDLDGDRKDDIVYWRPSNGAWSYLKSSTNFASSGSLQLGTRGDWPMADMDIDGDGTDDRVIWNQSVFRFIPSTTGVLREITFGARRDIPVSNHDMDGDGKDDLTLWSWSDRQFYVVTSRSNFASTVSYPWGEIGDIPVGGIDADRDGKDDFVVWRPTQRLYWVRYSASNFTTSAAFTGGQPGDIPVGGTDIDRDGKDDLTTWRPSDGNWTALTSASNFASTVTQQWGGRGDVPIIGTDIDKDGKRDIGIWRPSIGTYYFKLSGTGFASSRSFVWGQ